MATHREIADSQQVMSPEFGPRLHMRLRDGPEIEISRRQARVFRTPAFD